MKRWISLILTVCLLAGAVPEAAATTQSFRNDFSFAGEPLSGEERLFREWAAVLVEKYRNEYAMLEPGELVVRQDSTPVLKVEFEWFQPKMEIVYEQRDAALYAPYYWIAEQKALFDGSTYAEKVNRFGVMTEDVPYRYGDIVNDPAKRQELYSWLLAETIRQKVESRPELLTGTDYVDRSRKGYYRYDLSTGTMVYDETLGFIQQQADADVAADAALMLTDALDVAVKAYCSYQNLKAKGANIASETFKNANSVPDYKTLVLDLVKELEHTLADTVKEGLQSLIKDIRDNAKKELANEIRGELKTRLANAYLNRNENIIGYLRSTYIDNPFGYIADFGTNKNSTTTYEPRAEFREAVIRLIQAIDDETARIPETVDAMLDEKQAALIAERVMSEEFLPAEQIYDAGTILYHVVTAMMIELLDGVTDALVTFVSDALKELLGKRSDNEDVISVILDYLTEDLLGETLRRMKISLKETIEEYDPAKLDSTDGTAAETGISDYWNDFTERYGQAMDSFPQYCLRQGLVRTIQLVLYLKDPDRGNSESQAAFEALTGSRKYSYGLREPDLGDLLILVGSIALGGVLSSFSEAVKGRLAFLNNTEKKDLEKALEDLQDAVNRAAVIRDETEYDLEIPEYVIAVITLVNELHDRYPEMNVRGIFYGELETAFRYVFAGAFADADVDDPEFSAYRDAHADTAMLENLLKNEGFWNLLMRGVFRSFETAAIAGVQSKAEVFAGETADFITPNEKALLQKNREYTDKRLNGNPQKADIIRMFTELFEDLWDSAKDLGGSFWSLVNSIADNLTGEDRASLIAQRINATKQISSILAMQLAFCTIGGIRTARYNSRDVDGLRMMDEEGDPAKISSMGNNRKNMNPNEIRNPDLTPDLNNIRALTNDIMTQMNLDASGMGAYYSMLLESEDYVMSDFFVHFLYPSHALVPQRFAESNLNRIVRLINEAEKNYNHDWDILFQE